MVMLLLTLAAAVFTVVGGVGGGLYIAYFACATILAILLTYFYIAFYLTTGSPTHLWGFKLEDGPVFDTVCGIIHCGRTDSRAGNMNDSPLTFSSMDGLLFGVISVLGKALCNFRYTSIVHFFLIPPEPDSVAGFSRGGSRQASTVFRKTVRNEEKFFYKLPIE